MRANRAFDPMAIMRKPEERVPGDYMQIRPVEGMR
jgi:hypothetical protein